MNFTFPSIFSQYIIKQWWDAVVLRSLHLSYPLHLSSKQGVGVDEMMISIRLWIKDWIGVGMRLDEDRI